MPKSVKLYFDSDYTLLHVLIYIHIDNVHIPKIQDTRYLICPFACTITHIYI